MRTTDTGVHGGDQSGGEVHGYHGYRVRADTGDIMHVGTY